MSSLYNKMNSNQKPPKESLMKKILSHKKVLFVIGAFVSLKLLMTPMLKMMYPKPNSSKEKTKAAQKVTNSINNGSTYIPLSSQQNQNISNILNQLVTDKTYNPTVASSQQTDQVANVETNITQKTSRRDSSVKQKIETDQQIIDRMTKDFEKANKNALKNAPFIGKYNNRGR